MNANQPEGYVMPSHTVFEQQMDEIRADMREMRGAITKMAEAMTKLSVLEERHLAANVAIEKIVNRLDKMETKLNAVELEQAKFESSVTGIAKAMKYMWAAFGGGVVFLGSEALKHAGPMFGG